LPNVRGLKFQAVYRPALRENELGGDWYDAFVLRDGRIALCIGDVAGHGIDAAIAMVRLRETLRAVTGFDDTDPGTILELADRAFMGTHPDTIATATFAIYDPPTRRLVHASAGHLAPALVRNETTTFLSGSVGLPLGVRPDSTFPSSALVLEAGDMLVFYTDGLIEVDRDVIAGERRFADTLARHADNIERVVSETLGGEQHDDVALLALSVLEVSPQGAWHFESDDAGSANDARFAFVAYLQRRNLDPDLIASAELVFGELVANVVRHAPGPIDIDLAWRDDTPLLTVRDRGPHFEVGSPTLPDDDFAERGRGLFIISCAASQPVVTARPGGGNEVAVALARPQFTPNPLVV
jgi:anti-sigma regulatory factor (Ser/Thr protein kinase)